MSNLTATEVRGMMNAYNAVHDPEMRNKLNEEQEVQELTLEIIENAAYVLFSQGYDVEDVISYFTEATEEVISEDFINFTEGNLILESVAVSDEYIAEQFQQLDEKLGGALSWLAKQGSRAKEALKGVKAAFTPAAKAPKPTPAPKQNILQAPSVTKPLNVTKPLPGNLAVTGGAKPQNILQRAASGAKELLKKVPGAKAAGKVIGRAAPGVGAALYGMDAVSRAKKGDWGGAALSGLGAGLSLAPGVGTLASLAPAGVQMATDAMGLTGDKSKKGPSAKTAPAAPKPPKGAGMVNVPGKGQRYYASSDKKYYKNYNDALAAMRSRRGEKPAAAKPAPAPAAPEVKATNAIAAKPSQPEVKPAKPATGTLGSTSFEIRTPTSAEFKGAQEYRKQNPNAKPEDVLKAAQEAGKRQTSVDAYSGAKPYSGTPKVEIPGKEIDTSVTKPQDKPVKKTVNASYEYDAYDLVLEYLFSEGHVDTLEEALYVMMEMPAETIQGIIEQSNTLVTPEQRRADELKYGARRTTQVPPSKPAGAKRGPRMPL